MKNSVVALALLIIATERVAFAEEPTLKDLRVETPTQTPTKTIDPNLKDIRNWKLDIKKYREEYGLNDTDLDYQHWGSDHPREMWQDTPSLVFRKNEAEENQEEDDEEGNWIQDGVYNDADDGADRDEIENIHIQKANQDGMAENDNHNLDVNYEDAVVKDLRKPGNDSEEGNMQSNNDLEDNDFWNWGSYSGGDPDNADLYQGDDGYYNELDHEALEEDAPKEKYSQTDDPPQEKDPSHGPRITYKKGDIEGQLDGKNAMDDVLNYYRFRKFEKHQRPDGEENNPTVTDKDDVPVHDEEAVRSALRAHFDKDKPEDPKRLLLERLKKVFKGKEKEQARDRSAEEIAREAVALEYKTSLIGMLSFIGISILVFGSIGYCIYVKKTKAPVLPLHV